MKALVLVLTHAAAMGLGFALGIYTLPILTAPKAPTDEAAAAAAAGAEYTGEFRLDLAGSDLLHWGEGTISVGAEAIVFTGELAPGPDYKLYLSPEFVDTEAGFQRIKARMAQIGEVKTFDRFVISVPSSVDVSAYTTVVVWCESFDQFITAARYR
jgi:hypothetical protein